MTALMVQARMNASWRSFSRSESEPWASAWPAASNTTSSTAVHATVFDRSILFSLA